MILILTHLSITRTLNFQSPLIFPPALHSLQTFLIITLIIIITDR